MKYRLGLLAIFCAASIAIVFSVDSSAQSTNKTYVKGLVSSSGKPLRSVWVVTSQNGREKGRSLTGDDGRYYLSNLDPGPYDIIVQNGKSQLYKGRINLPQNSTYNIAIR
jgi:hypothetical protein